MPLSQAFANRPAENTMNDGAKRSAKMSFARLKRRYAATINFESCIESLCLFLRINGDQNDIFDKFRVAERALYPHYGAVGINRGDNLKMALYYWQAAIDESPNMISSVEDRRLCIVRALYECQRGNNDANPDPGESNSGRVNFIDNHDPVDGTVCVFGVNNKFAEVMLAMHPDIEIIDRLQARVLELILAFVAEYLFGQNKTFADLKNSNLNLAALVPETVRATIKNQIIETLGRAGDRYEGYLTETELNYMDLALGAYFVELDYATIATEVKLRELIADANFQLRESRALRSQRSGYLNTLAAQNSQEPEFNQARINQIITDFVPQPHNQVRVHGNFGFETLNFNTATRSVNRNAGQRYPIGTMFDYRWYYTEQQLDQAMQPQAQNLDATQVANIRQKRRIKMGGRPNYLT